MSESDRRVLHQALVEHVGEREAGVLMDLLPPAGAGDLALRTDVVALRGEIEGVASSLRLEMQAMEWRLTAGFHRDMVRQTWILAGTLLAGIGGLGGLLH